MPKNLHMKIFAASLSFAFMLGLGASSICAQTAASMPPSTPAPPRLRPDERSHSRSQNPKSAQEDELEVADNDVVRVSTNLITVPAEVMDRSGRYIGNLRKRDFRIFENGAEQELAYFASVDQPFTVALLLDVSGSTQARLQAIRTAANVFIKGLRPNDRVLLVSFDGKINVLTEAVTVSELRKKKLRLDAVNDNTLLYDTVGFVLKQRLAGMQGRKAIVLLTDGVDLGSKKSSYKRTLRDAEEANVVVYTVRYNTLPQLPERLSRIVDLKVRERVLAKMTKEYPIGYTYLHSLAEKTGGRFYNAETLSDVPGAFRAITEELGRQYSLGYYPKGPPRLGEKRDINVRTTSPNLIVRARVSYTATALASH
jgi:Ca-activated chloride channel homolog